MTLEDVKKIEELTDDPDMVQYIDVEKGMELGRKQDIEKAAKEAAEKEKIETARKMLEDNLDISVISKYTGLSIQKINSLN